MNRLGRMAGAGGRAVLDLLLPPSCPSCEGPVVAQDQLCAACFGNIAFLAGPACDRCGLPFGRTRHGASAAQCEACAGDPPPWTAARAAMLYDEHARRLILPLKHGDRTENARVLGLHMARAGAALLAQAAWLVPVPLHRRRLLARRYNQAALLAHDLTRRSGVPTLADALIRHRNTSMLADLPASRRAEEIAGAIEARPGRTALLEGRAVLLVDDVLTSGATAGACARALIAAGAARVDLLVACRVPAPH